MHLQAHTVTEPVQEEFSVAFLFDRVSGYSIQFPNADAFSDCFQRLHMCFVHDSMEILLFRAWLGRATSDRLIAAIALVTAAVIHYYELAPANSLFRCLSVRKRASRTRRDNSIERWPLCSASPKAEFQVSSHLGFSSVH